MIHDTNREPTRLSGNLSLQNSFEFYVVQDEVFYLASEIHVSEYDLWYLQSMDATRIELVSPDCKSGVLPLYYAPVVYYFYANENAKKVTLCGM